MKFSFFPPAPLAVLALLAATALAATSAKAQGTDEQREACAPDAIKLCQDTIPDIPKTTACMKAHFAELSPRCKVAFNGATGGSSRAARHREAAAPPPPAPEAAPAEATTATLGGFGLLPGMQSYEAQIRGYCRDGLIDPYTCRNTLAYLHGMQ